jgi:fumarate reductase (CoM/CoB) subunit A
MSEIKCFKEVIQMSGIYMDADVLVIGGGMAGMRAAIEANSLGAKVVMAFKGKLGKTGAGICAYHGAGVGPWSTPQDSKELHLKDVIKCGGYLADQELCKIMIDEVPDRLVELEKYGLFWERKNDGGIDAYLGSGHSEPRTISTYRRQAGLSIHQALKAEITRRQIAVIEDTMVTTLILRNESVVGATALHYTNGEFMNFRAKSVIICTGSHSQVFPSCTTPPDCTGDGVVMGYHAGAELINMEQALYVFGLSHPHTWRGILVPTLFKVGGDILHLLNKKGERYMQRYDPEHLEMATKDVHALSAYKEIQRGMGGGEKGDTLYADLRHLPYKEMREKLGDLVTCMEEMELDVRKDLIEITPTAHETMGGIRINARCESTVPGLFAAGSAIGAIYGNDGIPGRGTGHALVFGKRAGEYASKRAADVPAPSLDNSEVERERQRVHNLLDRENGIRPHPLMKKLQQLMEQSFWVAKDEAHMRRALEEILKLREEEVPRLSLSSRTKRFNLEWVNALEVEKMIDVAEMMIRSALPRKESRTTFLREDYPEEDNVNWLKNIVVQKKNGEMHISTVPVKLIYVRPEE